MQTATSIYVQSLDKYSLHCRYWPAKDPHALAILQHGVVSHSGWLEKIGEGLASCGISCVASDRRGAGKNDVKRGDAPSAAILLEDLDAVVKWCSNKGVPIHAVGFCWGANYWVNYLSKNPTQCRSVSLVAPSLFPSALITDQHFEIGDSPTPDQIPLIPIECFTDGPYFRDLIEPDPLRLRLVSTRLNRIMSEFSQAVWMKFLRLKIPVLLALASSDEVVDNQSTTRLFERYEGAPKQLIKLQGMHGIQFDAGSELIQQLSVWIKQHSDLPV